MKVTTARIFGTVEFYKLLKYS